MRWSNHLARICVCASVMLVPFAAQAATEEDPWESVNRPIFKFNDVIDTYALKPLAQGYQYVTPQFVEDGVHNPLGLPLGKVRRGGQRLDQVRFRHGAAA